MGISKITRNFQVTIPKDIRTVMNLHIGDSILIKTEGSKAYIVKMDKQKE